MRKWLRQRCQRKLWSGVPSGTQCQTCTGWNVLWNSAYKGWPKKSDYTWFRSRSRQPRKILKVTFFGTPRTFIAYRYTSTRLDICPKKIAQPNFRAKEFYTLRTRKWWLFLPAIKQRKCIIISNVVLFWLNLNEILQQLWRKFALCVCKLTKYVQNCVVFWKNLHSWPIKVVISWKYDMIILLF